jgi:thymidylate kinase
MKHIVIEGGDGLGKNSLIEALCRYYNYNNVAIRHFDKPPKGLTPKETLEFQFQVFHKEFRYAQEMMEFLEHDEYGYHENVLIWNRSHLGEFVYSQMFRGISRRDVAKRINSLERMFIHPNQYLITLSASPKFFLDQEDGESLSQNLDEKDKELHLFREVHTLSLIENKKLIKVNEGQRYKGKDIIFNEVLEFIK